MSEVTLDLNQIEDKVKKIIVDQLGVELSSLTKESSFVDDLGADSLDIVELVMIIEEEFDVVIPDDEAEKVKTLNDVVQFIAQHQAQKA